MRDTKLIMLDGLPGAGTSTQAKWLEEKLKEQKIPVKRYHEFDRDNPLNWIAWWDGGIDAVLDAYREIEKSMAYSLSRWEALVAASQDIKETIIIENIPFQNTIGLFKHADADEEAMTHYALKIHDLMQVFNPVIVYFYPQDSRWALKRILEVRGSDFEAELIENMNRMPYFKNRGLTGIDGIVQLWESTQELYEKLYGDYSIPILKIDFSAENWKVYQSEIKDFLGL